LNKQYKNLLKILTKFGLNIQKLLILQNTQNCGGIRSVRENLRDTKSQSELKIGETLRALSKRLNMFFSILRFKKLQQKIVILGNL